MTPALSPAYDLSDSLCIPMSIPQLARRSSRSSGSQSGCRSSRVEKPRSNHNSPRVMERRKTTSSTKRYATLDDHYNMMFGLTGDDSNNDDDDYFNDSRREQPRPMSWHPSSSQFHVPPPSSAPTEHSQPPTWSRQNSASSRHSAYGSDFYSLSARSSVYPDQSRNPGTQPNYHEPNRGSQSSDASWQDPSHHQPSSYALSSYSTPSTGPMPWYLQEWTRKTQAQANNASSDFLPIQHPSAEQDDDAADEDEDEDMEDSGKELVGMGLYDLPDSALWGSALVESTGKGLKLEETWQPPEDEDEDEDEDEEDEQDGADDASSDDGSVEDLPTAKEERVPPLAVNVKPALSGNMDGQSFFFDEDDSYTKDWWFQQLKQPSLPVRDAGLSYAWL